MFSMSSALNEWMNEWIYIYLTQVVTKMLQGKNIKETHKIAPRTNQVVGHLYACSLAAQ